MAECPSSRTKHLSNSDLQEICDRLGHLPAGLAPVIASGEQPDRSLEELQNVFYVVAIGAEESDG